MKALNYKFHFMDNVLFLEFNTPILNNTIDEAIIDIKETFPHKDITIIAYKNILGYWAAYQINPKHSIYCGTTSLKDTKEKINNFLNNK
jgi:hypothetical protein